MARGKIKAKGKGNFIDFILDIQNDSMLVSKFLLYTDPNDLKQFFDDNGYDVTLNDVNKILIIRKTLAAKVSLQCVDDYY